MIISKKCHTLKQQLLHLYSKFQQQLYIFIDQLYPKIETLHFCYLRIHGFFRNMRHLMLFPLFHQTDHRCIELSMMSCPLQPIRSRQLLPHPASSCIIQLIINCSYFFQKLQKFEMSNSAQKWKEAEKTLAQQESFVQGLVEKRQKMLVTENNANLDNILASSIQKAKEKISNFQSKTENPFSRSMNHSRDENSKTMLNFSRDKKQKSTDNAGVVGAMKKLQEKVSELQKINQTYERQNKLYKVENQSLQSQKKVILSGLEETKRKNISFESALKKSNAEMSELKKRNQILQKQLKKRLTAENIEKQSKLKQKLSNSQMLYKAKTQQLQHKIIEVQDKERGLLELENKRKQEEIHYQQEIGYVRSYNKELQMKITSLEEKQKSDTEMIKILKDQLKKQEDANAQTKMHLHKMQELEDEIQSLKQSQRYQVSSPRNSQQQKMDILKQQLKQIRQKHQELFYTYKNLDEKCRREQRQAKNFRSKFWQLKELTKQMIDKINSLPNGVTSQLRYLITKIKKMEAFGNDYYMSTPMKSSRKKSICSSSKSRSNSKRKGLQLDDLDISKNSAKSRRSVKSNRSMKSSQKSKKQVILSNKGFKSVQIQSLEQRIQEIRKQYKALAKQMGKSNDDHVRNRLNDLAIELQEKSEQLTILKKKK